jgi:hypothetical protein
MNVELVTDYPYTDEECREATGKTIAEWMQALEGSGVTGRRESMKWIWDQTGQNQRASWWGTTLVVEYERSKGIVKKDGRIDGYGICSTKSIKAPVANVQSALAEFLSAAENVRVKDGKGIKATWKTDGVATTSEVDIALTSKDDKTSIVVNHNRIDGRQEADGLRRLWSAKLDELKKGLEG